MSDPRYRDPLPDQPPFEPEANRARQLGRMESANAMWGWIAGGVVVVLLLLFIFGRSPNTTDTATEQTVPPPATTATVPPARQPPANAQAPTPTPPVTTGQGTPK